MPARTAAERIEEEALRHYYNRDPESLRALVRRLIAQAQEHTMHPVQSPRTDDAGIENEIQAKGLTAPRVTPADIEANIVRAFYFTAQQGAEKAARDSGSYAAGSPEEGEALGLLTFCVLVLRNGFTVSGESACASPANFDAGVRALVAAGDLLDPDPEPEPVRQLPLRPEVLRGLHRGAG